MIMILFSMITRVTAVSALACPTVWIDAKKDARLKNVLLYKTEN